jgi:hypothetical protein
MFLLKNHFVLSHLSIKVLINNVTEVVANNPTLKNVIQSNLSDRLQQTLASYLQKFGRSI